TSATTASGPGAYPVSAQLSDPDGRLANYDVRQVTGTLTVTPAPLTVSARDCAREYGQENPTFEVRYDGFVLGEGPADLGGLLTLSTRAGAASPPGTYAVTPAGLTSDNYALRFLSGRLEVVPAATRTT